MLGRVLVLWPWHILELIRHVRLVLMRVIVVELLVHIDIGLLVSLLVVLVGVLMVSHVRVLGHRIWISRHCIRVRLIQVIGVDQWYIKLVQGILVWVVLWILFIV